MSILGIVIAILVFGVIITVHEFGHFAAAKLCGIKVNKFAIGMGPRLIKFGKGETEYSLRLFPIGGFCQMEGEDEDSDDDRAFSKKPVWQRMIVIVSGAFMNIVLGVILAITVTSLGDKVPTVKIEQFIADNVLQCGIAFCDISEKDGFEAVEEKLGFAIPEGFQGIYINSISETANIAKTALKTGDFITQVGDDVVTNGDEITKAIAKYKKGEVVNASCIHLLQSGDYEEYHIEFTLTPVSSGSLECGLKPGDEFYSVNGLRIRTDIDLNYKIGNTKNNNFNVVVIRDGKKVSVDNVVFNDPYNGSRFDFYIASKEKTFGNVMSYSLKETASVGKVVWLSLGDLLGGRYGVNDMTGPVGIISMLSDTATGSEATTVSEKVKENSHNVLWMAMLMTINVGIFNLLPLPALDGSRFVFLAIEGVRGKPIKKEAYVHAIGMLLLFGLMIYLTFNDIIRIGKR